MSAAVYKAACRCILRHPLKAVLKEMAWYANEAGESIWPSVRTLADNTSLSRRAVQKLLRQLEDLRAIQALGSRLGGRSKTTEYRISLEWIEKNSKTAHSNRPSRFAQVGEYSANGEPQSLETANPKTGNSEPGAPEQKEHEYEKKRQPFSQKTKKREAISYEAQRMQQTLRTIARQKFVPAPLTTEQREARLQLLRSQAQLINERSRLT